MAASSRSAQAGEFHLLAKVRAAVEAHGRGRGVVTGIGDDCAVVAPSLLPGVKARGASSQLGAKRGAAAPALLLTTDTMVEGVHFERAWLSPKELGVRAFRAAVSDVAAMGGRPAWILLSLEIPAASLSERDALALVKAVSTEARACGAALVGGNVSGGPRLAVTVTVVGETVGERALLRSGAKAGDLVFATGALGGAAAGWRALASAKTGARAMSSAYRRPPLRLDLAAALARAGLAHAMIDVSDGLLQDLGHIADESRVAILVDPTLVPVHPAARSRRTAPGSLDLALTGGEDYELAFTAPASARAGIVRIAKACRTPLSVIGLVAKRAKGEAAVTDLDGLTFDVAEAGFDHLRSSTAPEALRKPPLKSSSARRAPAPAKPVPRRRSPR